jgi:hypothetical protein
MNNIVLTKCTPYFIHSKDQCDIVLKAKKCVFFYVLKNFVGGFLAVGDLAGL